MSKMIQLRNVPDDLHRRLKARAALAGLSLSDYLIEEVRRSAELPTRQELLERVRQRGPVEVTESPAELLRLERESR